MSLWLRRLFLPCALLPLCTVLFGSCGLMDHTETWKSAVANQTAQLGYRNWIVIAEASFPAHSRTGIRQVTANAEAPVVLDEVLNILEQTEHVRPRLYVCREMRSVDNDFAPGIEEYRKNIHAAMHGRETTELEQASLMTLLQDVTKSFDVLVIRTTTALPYTSVFLELEPGYWDGESEDRLRAKIQADRARMEKLARPFP